MRTGQEDQKKQQQQQQQQMIIREADMMNGANPFLNQIWIPSMAFEEPSCKFHALTDILLLVKDVSIRIGKKLTLKK